jgi:hypothetical protein
MRVQMQQEYARLFPTDADKADCDDRAAEQLVILRDVVVQQALARGLQPLEAAKVPLLGAHPVHAATLCVLILQGMSFEGADAAASGVPATAGKAKQSLKASFTTLLPHMNSIATTPAARFQCMEFLGFADDVARKRAVTALGGRVVEMTDAREALLPLVVKFAQGSTSAWQFFEEIGGRKALMLQIAQLGHLDVLVSHLRGELAGYTANAAVRTSVRVETRTARMVLKSVLEALPTVSHDFRLPEVEGIWFRLLAGEENVYLVDNAVERNFVYNARKDSAEPPRGVDSQRRVVASLKPNVVLPLTPSKQSLDGDALHHGMFAWLDAKELSAVLCDAGFVHDTSEGGDSSALVPWTPLSTELCTQLFDLLGYDASTITPAQGASAVDAAAEPAVTSSLSDGPSHGVVSPGADAANASVEVVAPHSAELKSGADASVKAPQPAVSGTKRSREEARLESDRNPRQMQPAALVQSSILLHLFKEMSEIMPGIKLLPENNPHILILAPAAFPKDGGVFFFQLDDQQRMKRVFAIPSHGGSTTTKFAVIGADGVFGTWVGELPPMPERRGPANRFMSVQATSGLQAHQANIQVAAVTVDEDGGGGTGGTGGNGSGSDEEKDDSSSDSDSSSSSSGSGSGNDSASDEDNGSSTSTGGGADGDTVMKETRENKTTTSSTGGGADGDIVMKEPGENETTTSNKSFLAWLQDAYRTRSPAHDRRLMGFQWLRLNWALEASGENSQSTSALCLPRTLYYINSVPLEVMPRPRRFQ